MSTQRQEDNIVDPGDVGDQIQNTYVRGFKIKKGEGKTLHQLPAWPSSDS
jgi:hypothetical protein